MDFYTLWSFCHDDIMISDRITSSASRFANLNISIFRESSIQSTYLHELHQLKENLVNYTRTSHQSLYAISKTPCHAQCNALIYKPKNLCILCPGVSNPTDSVPVHPQSLSDSGPVIYTLQPSPASLGSNLRPSSHYIN